MYFIINNQKITEMYLGRLKLVKDANHSFYVYILHFIIHKTFVMILFECLISQIGFAATAILCTLVAILITFVVAIVFEKCFNFIKMCYNKLSAGN